MCIFVVLNVLNVRRSKRSKRARWLFYHFISNSGSWNNCYIFFVLNMEELQKCFLKTRAVRNSCSKGNIDRSKNVLAETDMIYVFGVITQVIIENSRAPIG